MTDLTDMHADEPGDLMTQSPDTGKLVPWSYSLALDVQGVRGREHNFGAMARATGGSLGRSPDFLAALLASWYAATDVSGGRDGKFAGSSWRTIYTPGAAIRSTLIMHPAERDLARPAAVSRSRSGSLNGGPGYQAQPLNLAADLAVGDLGARQLQLPELPEPLGAAALA